MSKIGSTLSRKKVLSRRCLPNHLTANLSKVAVVNTGLPYIFGTLFQWTLLTAVLIGSEVFAQSAVGIGSNFQPQFHFSTNAAEPIIEYTQVHYMLADPDPEPLLRIYGNGRVHLHQPGYMKRSGDYELWLNPKELNDLLISLSQDGILDFDPAVARSHKQQLETRRRVTNGTMFYVSDTTETIINIRLDEYRRNSAYKGVVNMRKRFSWKNLEHDARNYPESELIRRAMAGEQKLRALINRTDMQKLE